MKSRTEPRIQSIPIRTEEGRRIRKALLADYGEPTKGLFRTEPGFKLLELDFSGAELAVLASMTKPTP